MEVRKMKTRQQQRTLNTDKQQPQRERIPVNEYTVTHPKECYPLTSPNQQIMQATLMSQKIQVLVQ